MPVPEHDTGPSATDGDRRDDGWWLDRVTSVPGTITIVLALLVLGWTTEALTFGVRTSGSYLVVLPVVLAAVRLGWVSAVITSVVAGVATGPLIPEAAAAWSTGSVVDMLARIAFLALIGVLAAGAVRSLRSRAAREHEIADRERQLDAQRAAIIESISHEFRTPLTVIAGVGQTLQARPDLVDPSLHPLVSSLERATERLDHLAALVLTVSDAVDRRDVLSLHEIDLDRAMTDVLGELAPAASDRVRVQIPAGARYLRTSPELLHLVLLYVVQHGLRTTPATAPLTIRSHRTTGEVVLRIAAEPTTAPAPAREGRRGVEIVAVERLVALLGGAVEVGMPDDETRTVVVRLPQRRTEDLLPYPGDAPDPAPSMLGQRSS